MDDAVANETTPLIAPTNQKRRRWRGCMVVIGGILMHLTFGTVYTFGNMNPYITSYLRVRGISNTTYADSVWFLSAMVSGTGPFIYVGGVIERRLGPRVATFTGCSILTSGVALTYFTIKSSFGATLVTYGVLFGMGKGIGYAVPLACAMRWFPDHKGLVSGFVVAGIGGGSFVFDQIQTAYINPRDEKPDRRYPGEEDRYFSQPDVLDRLPTCFLLLGGLYAALQLIGVLLVTNPPSFTYHESEVRVPDKEKGMAGIQGSINTTEETCENTDTGIKSHPVDYKPLAMVKTRQFYVLWFTLLFIDHGIAFLASLWKAYGQTFIHDDKFLAYVGAFSSVGNGAGRILWGHLGDKFSFKVAMLCVCTSFSALMLTLELTRYGGKPLFFIWVFLLFLSFSGTYSLFPAEVVRRFGPRYYSMNYGVMMAAGTISGILVGVMTSQLQALLGWVKMIFTIAGIVLCGLVLTYVYKEDHPRAPTCPYPDDRSNGRPPISNTSET